MFPFSYKETKQFFFSAAVLSIVKMDDKCNSFFIIILYIHWLMPNLLGLLRMLLVADPNILLC